MSETEDKLARELNVSLSETDGRVIVFSTHGQDTWAVLNNVVRKYLELACHSRDFKVGGNNESHKQRQTAKAQGANLKSDEGGSEAEAVSAMQTSDGGENDCVGSICDDQKVPLVRLQQKVDRIEEKLAQELGFRVLDDGAYIETEDGRLWPQDWNYAGRLWRKCLELTDSLEDAEMRANINAKAIRLANLNADQAEDKARELTEQRDGWESPEALHDVARAFDGKWKVLFRIPFTNLEIAVFWRH